VAVPGEQRKGRRALADAADEGGGRRNAGVSAHGKKGGGGGTWMLVCFLDRLTREGEGDSRRPASSVFRGEKRKGS